MTSINQEIKDAVKDRKLVIGSRSVMKSVKRGVLDNVVFAENCPEITRKDLEYYEKGGFVKIKPFKGTSLQLGEICGKPFNVLLIGIKK
jgi:large subunit ribosomal protein L30e